MQNQLTDFIRARKTSTPGADIDWQAKLEAWVQAVQRLYDSIRDMLRDSIQSGDVTLRTWHLDLTEDYLGTYSVPALELRIGNERVEFRPKGLRVLGAEGRVDLTGEGGTMSLIRNESQQQGEWSVIMQRVPRLQFSLLNPESLQYALERVMLPLP